MVRSQCSVEVQRLPRSSASRIELYAGDKRNSGHVGHGCSASIEPWSRADNLPRVIQTNDPSKAEKQTHQGAADEG
jgi:hypothetical protein